MVATTDQANDEHGLLGRQFGGYRVDAVIGRGGMSVVYRASDTALGGRPVALKVLSTRLGTDPNYRERFVREAEHAAAVDHPHLVPIYRAGVAEDRPFLAMRLVDGPDLRALLKRGPLEPRRALIVLGQVAHALDAVHRTGLIHRDIKPGNVLVTTADGGADHAYLTDFGIARPEAGHATLTRPGELIGTPAYLAPEQITGHTISPRTDVYALACLLYECLTGHRAFHRADAQAVLHAHLAAPPPQVSALRPDLPPGLDQVLAAGLAKDPNARYPSCSALISAAVDVFAGPVDVGTRPAAAPSPVQPSTSAAVAPRPYPGKSTPALESSVYYRPPRQPARRLVGALCTWLALTGLDLMVDIGHWASLVPRRLLPWEQALDAGQAVAFGVCAVLFARWLRWVYDNIAHLGARGQRFGLGWASIGGFVPILGLYRPKQIANDVWRASDPDLPPEEGERWRFGAVPPILGLWWAAYLAMVAMLSGHDGPLGWLGAVLTLGIAPALLEPMSKPLPGMLADLTGLVAGGLAILVVRRIYHRQEARAGRLGAPMTTRT